MINFNNIIFDYKTLYAKKEMRLNKPRSSLSVLAKIKIKIKNFNKSKRLIPLKCKNVFVSKSNFKNNNKVSKRKINITNTTMLQNKYIKPKKSTLDLIFKKVNIKKNNFEKNLNFFKNYHINKSKDIIKKFNKLLN